MAENRTFSSPIANLGNWGPFLAIQGLRKVVK